VKRDLDLMRDLLLKIEALPAGPAAQYRMDEVDDPVLLAHLEMLLASGLVNGTISRSHGSRGDIIAIAGLTWDGHEWIEAVRDARVWDETKRTCLENGGVLTFDLARAVAKRIHRIRLGLPAGEPEVRR
jgi:hypothetical protein